MPSNFNDFNKVLNLCERIIERVSAFIEFNHRAFTAKNMAPKSFCQKFGNDKRMNKQWFKGVLFVIKHLSFFQR